MKHGDRSLTSKWPFVTWTQNEESSKGQTRVTVSLWGHVDPFLHSDVYVLLLSVPAEQPSLLLMVRMLVSVTSQS